MKVCLVGNPNSGKTTLFNCLTGMNAKIGNWPGVTIEKKSGIIKNTSHEITDLPGIYSLSPYSLEEEVARKYIFEENPAVIINIIDATSIERSLYLTTQLMELDTRVIISLNMADLLEKKGLEIDVRKLEKILGTRVFVVSALKEKGILELINEINKAQISEKKSIFDSNIEKTVEELQIKDDVRHKRFVAVKLLEDDKRFTAFETTEVAKMRAELSRRYDADLVEIIAEQRYNFIENVKKQTVTQIGTIESSSDRLDKIFLNRILALPIFVLIMFLTYYLSVGIVGKITTDWINDNITNFGIIAEIKLNEIGVSNWLISLIVDGIIAGVGTILSFVPQLLMLFLCISLLETTGYMARIALLLDNLFRKLGLSGKSLIPFIIGSGCSVPGIMGTRIIENEDERKLTGILVSFIPCSAKLPIIALFSGYFFEENVGIISTSLYFLAISIIIISAYIMSKTVYKHKSSSYISELPEYKIPNLKYVIKDVCDKVEGFLRKAGSTILLCSIAIWFLLSFSLKLEYGIGIENSILAEIGRRISWIFYPMIGEYNWGVAVSAIQGLVAKEQVVSSMAIISELTENVTNIFGEGSMFSGFTGASAYAFMVFNLFSAPCIGAITAMKNELKSTKEVAIIMVFQTICAWLLSVIIYKVGRLIEVGELSVVDNIIVLSIAIIAFFIVILKSKNDGCAGCPYCKSCGKN